MARVLTRCPNGGESVHTGRHMSDAAFSNLSGEFAFRCACCSEIHHWRPDEAWLEAQRGVVLEAVGG